MHTASGASRSYHDSSARRQPAELLDRGPPYDGDAERAVLAGLLLTTAGAVVGGVAEALKRFAKVAAIVRPDDFLDIVHRSIYEAMLRLYVTGRPPGDLTLLVGEMRDAEVYNAVDGPSADTLLYLYRLHPHAVSIDYYVARLKDISRRRHARERGISLIQKSLSGDQGPSLPPPAIRRATRQAVERRNRRNGVQR
jgi:replicative DNA helicase